MISERAWRSILFAIWMIIIVVAAFFALVSYAGAAEIRVPFSCRVLGSLHGIDVPATATVEEARAGLAQAEQRADANLPGVRLCLTLTRRAIAKAENAK